VTAPYYEDDRCRLYLGDNVETLMTFQDACIDLTVTSPPYDNLREYGGHSWDFEGVAQQLWRVTKQGGVVVWVVADATVDGSETGTSFRQALRFMEIGFRLHDTMIYEVNGTGAKGSNLAYWQTWEYMFVLSRGRPNTFLPLSNGKRVVGGGPRRNPDGTKKFDSRRNVGHDGRRSNVWRYNVGKDVAGDHPAPFPEFLARDHILSWSNEGDTILDPFSGSGTTLKMAKHNGRKGIGIEVNREYCDITVNRLRQKVLF